MSETEREGERDRVIEKMNNIEVKKGRKEKDIVEISKEVEVVGGNDILSEEADILQLIM